MFYACRGSIPPKRHTQHRAPDGSLYAEELFGVEGFTGRSSLLYHVTPPTRTYTIEPVSEIRLEEADDGYHHHRLIDAAGVAQYGDAVMERLRSWWAAHTDKTCATNVTVYTGVQPLHDFLERQTWHSAQHVRQLAAVLERFGIEPDGRLSPADLAGLPLPKALWG